MVITNLEEKQNKKFFVPIRPGNRGGWDQFRWETVRQMPYKSREMYLGNSAMIGVLDKGGKWRKKDWYVKTQKKYQAQSKDELQLAMKKDQERINAALGLAEQDQPEEKLTQQQMKQLLKKIKRKGQDIPENDPEKMIGLGFDKSKVEIRAKPGISQFDPYRIEGTVKQQKERKHKKQKQQKRQKRHKQKKQKKEKKKSKKHRHTQKQQSRSRSRDKSKRKNRRIDSSSDEN